MRGCGHIGMIRGAHIKITHDRLDLRRSLLQLPGGTVELISHSLAQRRNGGLQALHFSQHPIDRIERLF
jgi:hypothetical protein